jgi:hypothetical protein
MKQTIEEAAKEHVYKARASFVGISPEEYDEQINPEYPYNIGTDKDFESLFIAGASYAISHLWTRVEDRLPEDGEYVLISTGRDIEPSVWNEHHQCWDDAEGDDYMYSKEYVEAWLPIPPLKGGDA